jgi:hypothetical protein
MEVIQPPYTIEFMKLLLPIAENKEIMGNMRQEKERQLITDFIGMFY